MNLLVFLALLVSGISSKHYVDANYVSHPHPAKKFNIVTQPGKDATDSMMVMMKGRDGAAGKDGTQGAPGLPGPPGQVGPPGLKGTQGICSKEQCESDRLQSLIYRVVLLEKYIKDKINQSNAALATTPSPPQAVTTPGPATTPAPPQKPVIPPLAPTQQIPPTQPPKATVAPPAPPQNQPAPSTIPVSTSPPQVVWGPPAPPPVSSPGPAPFGFSIQSTLEAPGTVIGNSGQVDIQGVVTPQVSVIQGYPGNPGTPRGSLVKKSRIFSDGSDTPKTKHVHKKSVHHSTGRNHHGGHKS